MAAGHLTVEEEESGGDGEGRRGGLEQEEEGGRGVACWRGSSAREAAPAGLEAARWLRECGVRVGRLG